MRRRMVGGLIPRAMSFGDFRMGLFLLSCPSNAGGFVSFYGGTPRGMGESKMGRVRLLIAFCRMRTPTELRNVYADKNTPTSPPLLK